MPCDHRGRNMPGSSASRKRVSHSDIGARTQVSSTTWYSFTSVIIGPHGNFVVKALTQLGGYEIVKRAAPVCISLGFILEHIARVDPAVCSYFMRRDLA